MLELQDHRTMSKINSILPCVFASVLVSFSLAGSVMAKESAEAVKNVEKPEIFTISTDEDSGPGSIRAALELANETGKPLRVDLGPKDGLFSEPRVIVLSKPLPAIKGSVEIDGHIPSILWKAYGATISGEGKFRIFEVAPGGMLQIRGITLKGGVSDLGGGILNHGSLIVDGVTFLENHATDAGGAVANQGGEIYMVNSTAFANGAERGGAVANLQGGFHLVNVTLHENLAAEGSAVFSQDEMQLSNSILTGQNTQCVNKGTLLKSTHNIFDSGSGCGDPLLSVDPHLGELGSYNGPTPTIPISSLSPARNLGDSSAAVDHEGKTLIWDQRGNGDPRFTRGFVDIGAFEHQTHLPSEHVVDTRSESILMGCTSVGPNDCPLSAAVALSLAGRHLVPVRFDQKSFSEHRVLGLQYIPQFADQPLIIDGAGTAGVTVIVPEPVPWKGINGVTIEVLDQDKS